MAEIVEFIRGLPLFVWILIAGGTAVVAWHLAVQMFQRMSPPDES